MGIETEPVTAELFRFVWRNFGDECLSLPRVVQAFVTDYLKAGEDKDFKQVLINTAQDYFLARLKDLSENRARYSSIRNPLRWRFSLIRDLGPAVAQGELGVAFVYPGFDWVAKLVKFADSDQGSACLLLSAENLAISSYHRATRAEKRIDLDFDRELARATRGYRLLRGKGLIPFSQIREAEKQSLIIGLNLESPTRVQFLDPAQVDIDFF